MPDFFTYKFCLNVYHLIKLFLPVISIKKFIILREREREKKVISELIDRFLIFIHTKYRTARIFFFCHSLSLHIFRITISFPSLSSVLICSPSPLSLLLLLLHPLTPFLSPNPLYLTFYLSYSNSCSLPSLPLFSLIHLSYCIIIVSPLCSFKIIISTNLMKLYLMKLYQYNHVHFLH